MNVYDEWQYDKNLDEEWHLGDGINWHVLPIDVNSCKYSFYFEPEHDAYFVKYEDKDGKILEQGYADFDDMQEIASILLWGWYNKRVCDVLEKTVEEEGHVFRTQDEKDLFRSKVESSLYMELRGAGAKFHFQVKGVPCEVEKAVPWCQTVPEVEVLALYGFIVQDLKAMCVE